MNSSCLAFGIGTVGAGAGGDGTGTLPACATAAAAMLASKRCCKQPRMLRRLPILIRLGRVGSGVG